MTTIINISNKQEAVIQTNDDDNIYRTTIDITDKEGKVLMNYHVHEGCSILVTTNRILIQS